MKSPKNLTLVLAAVTLLSLGASCRPKIKSDLPLGEIKIAGKNITVEIANKAATRETGLMFREGMADNTGMLFVFKEPQQLYFWMKNTPIPLSIAFVDEKGAILNILEMPPMTESTFPSKGAAKYALEMNSGWFLKNGVKSGDRVEGIENAPQAQE
ncbi:MAG TPA: DUF192 domain-containing protein [bacterium]|nr:DUF192 domain-containing protein [bacterium]